jgi:CHAT domain-containing protein
VAEIQRDLDLTAAELVCLSACDSGVSATDLWRIDDYLGIDGAFLACGARAVLSTLWAVTDGVALLFTATVYHALAGGETLAAAYRTAVSTFATGAYRNVDASHPVGAVLAEAGVDWQAQVGELDEMDIDLAHPFYWGVFKLSGLVSGQVDALMNPA